MGWKVNDYSSSYKLFHRVERRKDSRLRCKIHRRRGIAKDFLQALRQRETDAETLSTQRKFAGNAVDERSDPRGEAFVVAAASRNAPLFSRMPINWITRASRRKTWRMFAGANSSETRISCFPRGSSKRDARCRNGDRKNAQTLVNPRRTPPPRYKQFIEDTRLEEGWTKLVDTLLGKFYAGEITRGTLRSD